MAIPQRKPNRLTGYDYSSAGYYFVTICTRNMDCVLSHVVGCDAHIAPLVKLTDIGQITFKHLLQIPGIDKYVIMPNHIHFIVKTDGTMWASSPTQSLSQIVRSFKTVVSKELGYSIWQRSYYDHIIRNEQDYRRIWSYIDENPIKWELDKYYR